MCKSKPMLQEEIHQLERSLLCEIAAHDKTKRRLAAQEREIERMRGNIYKGQAKTAYRICVGRDCSARLDPDRIGSLCDECAKAEADLIAGEASPSL